MKQNEKNDFFYSYFDHGALHGRRGLCGYDRGADPEQSRHRCRFDGGAVAAVYNLFGVKRGDVVELKVTNAEEREYLEGYVDSAIIGTRSISCVYVELLGEGAGMDVTTSNITWCTAEMYISALATAGVTDAKVVVAAPFEVSGAGRPHRRVQGL